MLACISQPVHKLSLYVLTTNSKRFLNMVALPLSHRHVCSNCWWINQWALSYSQVFLDKVKTSKRRLELGLASSSLPLGIRNGWGILKPGRNKRLEKERESVCVSTRECVCVITRVCVFVCVCSRELLVGCFKESPASQVRDGQPDWPIKYSWRVCGHSLSNFRHLPKMLNSTFDSLPKFSKLKKNHKCYIFPVLRFFHYCCTK